MLDADPSAPPHTPQHGPAAAPGLDDYVAAFERACACGPVDPADFLPPPDDPLYLSVLREIVRVDLEVGWAEKRPLPLSDYQSRFPVLFADPAAAGDIAFEEYRQRLKAGERPEPSEYADRYGILTDDWPPPETAEFAAVERTRVVRRSAPPAATRAVPDSGAEAGRAALAEELSRCDPQAADRLNRGLASLPEVGGAFAGFRLIGQLGRGAFGTVFLARQGELADRPVAVKIAPDLLGETQTLAQLLHANIVPVYSVHRSGPLLGICMPYLGRTTLTHVLRHLAALPAPPTSGAAILSALEQTPAPIDSTPTESPIRTLLRSSSYGEGVLWLAARLADGLAHAHERGILHRDLKPANILLTDEGQPMLLDFNLAQDTKATCAVAQVGGTLPFMAPEQLEAFRSGKGRPDARADLFSLGVILYQLLALHDPYPARRGPAYLALPALIADRRAGPAPLVAPGVTPAVAAIVRKCLDPDPARRYQSAADLREDLERQRSSLPLKHAPNPSLRERLRKWVRRHPRSTSSSTVGFVATLVLAAAVVGFVAWGRHLDREREAEAAARSEAEARAHARALFDETRQDVRHAQYSLVTRTGDADRLREGANTARRFLDHYGVLSDPDWRQRPDFVYLTADRQEEVRGDVGEVLLLLARAIHFHPTALGDVGGPEEPLRLTRLAVDAFPPGQAPPTLWKLRAQLAKQFGHADEAAEATRFAAAAPTSSRDLYLEGAEHTVRGHFREALPLLQEATRRDPQNFLAWFVQGYCHHLLSQFGDAIGCYTTCVALRPDFAPSHYNRGLARLYRNDESRYQDNLRAAADFTEAIRLDPVLVDAYFDRAVARRRLKDPRGAIADLDRVLELRPGRIEAYFNRALSRREIGDGAGAGADEAEGLRHSPEDEAGLLARGSFRMRAGDNARALADFEAVLRRNPRSISAINNKSFLLGEKLNRVAEAVEVLDGALQLFPDSVPLRMGRAVYLARLGRRDAALADAAICLRVDGSAQIEYRVACLYAQTARQHDADRAEALRHLAAALRKGYDRINKLDDDHDLDPLRWGPETRIVVPIETVHVSCAASSRPQDAEFVRLVQAARALRERPAEK
jgi:serine/threonine protein kinase/tetratricopeptide (TPR) repeat protein